MPGFLVPPWYEEATLSPNDFIFIHIIWGSTLTIATFTSSKAARQTYQIWRRGRLSHPYIIMIWLELSCCVLMSILLWLFFTSYLELSFQLLFGSVCLWTIQIQCLMQIIINRITLIMSDEERARRLKWAVAIILGFLNVSVFVIWIPAHLEISPTWIHTNKIWDRVEKVIFCLVDGGLNLYFVFLVNTRLIAYGLTKYKILFRWNLVIVFISLSLDVSIIGIMSLPNDMIFTQFHPLMYLTKLHIELNMADLIVKIAKASNNISGSLLYNVGCSDVAVVRGEGLSALESHHQCACMCHIVRVTGLPDSVQPPMRQQMDPPDNVTNESR